jgi:tetratricopeptide (TPR) repeat protein
LNHTGLFINTAPLSFDHCFFWVKRFVIALLLTLAFLPALAQSKKKLVKLGDQSYTEGNFYNASHYYNEAMKRDSSKLPLLYKYASSLRMLNEYEKAEFYYQKVLKGDKNSEFPETLFYLAMMQRSNEKYAEAKKNFRKVNNKSKRDKSSYFFQKSAQEMAACDFALNKKKAAFIEDLVVENAGKHINTIHADFGAVQSSEFLYYSSLRTGDSPIVELDENEPMKWIKLFKQKLDTTGLSAAEELPEIINLGNHHNANGSFSPDGELFYFSRCGTDKICNIWKANVTETGFAKAVSLSEHVNLKGYSSTQPSLALIDGKQYLFFSSNRPGGHGGLDIWHSEIIDGKASKASNAGKIINSIEDEVTPFYHSPSKSFYFSSNWHVGFGNFDIFKSEGIPGDFKEPENVGLPLNSGANDFYYTIDSAALIGYFTSNRKGAMVLEGETCCNDIYRFIYPNTEVVDTIPIAEKLVDELNKWLPVTLYFHNDEPNPRTTDTITKINYLKAFASYVSLMETYKTEYSKGLKGEEAEEARENIEDFFEEQVQKGLKDLAFAGQMLQKIMAQGHHIELTVKGYASPLAKSDYNVNLTKRRISSLKNYLMEYEEGFFLPYMQGNAENGGKISVVEMPFGAYKAADTVSANLNDLKNSVYSRAAAMERKIEIIGIALKDSIAIVKASPEKEEERYPTPKVENPSFDFGKVEYGKVVEHQFKIKNEGDTDLIIFDAIGSCGCTIPEFSKKPIPPGQEATVTVKFDTLGKLGKQKNTVVLSTNAVPGRTTLTISAEVFMKTK